MGNTVPPRASSREVTGTGTGTGTGRRRAGAATGRVSFSENVVVPEVVAPPATPSRRVVTTVRKQGRDDDDKEETTRAWRPRAGRSLPEGVAAPAPAGKVVLTVKIVMTRRDAEALVARLKLKAQIARERKTRMAELKGELRAGTCSRGAPRPMLPPIKENRFERITPVV